MRDFRLERPSIEAFASDIFAMSGEGFFSMLKKGAVGTRRRLKKWDLKKDKESVLEAERLFNVAQHAAHALNTAFAQVPGGPGEFRNAPGLHGIESLPDGISLDGVGKELRFLRADRKIFIEHKDARGLELGEFSKALFIHGGDFGSGRLRGRVALGCSLLRSLARARRLHVREA